jgi:hypothetical protein
MVFRAHIDDPVIRIGSDLWSGDVKASELALSIRSYIDTPQGLAGATSMDGRSVGDWERGTTDKSASILRWFELALGKEIEAEDQAGWLELIDPKK